MLGDDGFSVTLPSMLAVCAFLLVSLAYAYASIFGRRFAAERVHPMAVAAGQHCCSALVIVPLALLIDRPWTLPMPSLPALAALLALGLLSGALAYTIFYRVLATAGATNVVLVTFMSPVTTILLGLALLGESLSAQQGAGMLLIALGLAVLDGRALTWARVRAA
jgi:drug/metabolite transporter (DMT)-like permease